MADILINGIQFPKFSPHVIEVYPDGTAIAHGKGIYGKAVPVPQHGRLIDADALEEKLSSDIDAYEKSGIKPTWNDAVVCVLTMPTVIPAYKDGET